MAPDLPERLKAAYCRCKDQPEVRRNDDGTFTVRGDAFMALLDLRALVPEIGLALHELRESGEFVAIKREVME